MMEQTFSFVKPDGVKRGLVGEIIKRFENAGLKLVACKMIIPSKDLFAKHYNSSDPARIKLWGEKTLKSYEKAGVDAMKELGTTDTTELGKMVSGWLMNYVTSAPIVAMIWEGENAVQKGMDLTGPTMPADAPKGTIRGDFSKDSAVFANAQKRGVLNLIHVSTSIEEANFEKNLWFTPSEIYEYERSNETSN